MTGMLCVAARAQGLDERLAAAERSIAAREWAAALEQLRGLPTSAAGPTELERVASLLQQVGAGAQDAGSLPQALAAHEAAWLVRHRLCAGLDHPDLVSSCRSVAQCLVALGRADEAVPRFEAALAMGMRLQGGGDHADVLFLRNDLAVCLQSQGRAGEALPHYEAMLAMSRRLYGDGDHPFVATSLNNVATCLYLLDRDGEALPLFEASFAMRKRLHGDRDHRDVAASLNNVAQCLESLGRTDEALPQFELALAMVQRLHGGRDHAEVAKALDKVALCLDLLGRGREAMPHFEASLAMRRRLHADRDHADVARSLKQVARALQADGRVDEALSLHEASLAMRRRLHADGSHPEVASSLVDLAFCLEAAGRLREALRHYEAARAMYERHYGPRDDESVAVTLNNLATCLRSLGRADEALPHIEASLAMRRRLDARERPDLVAGLNNLAACLQSLGRADEALPHYEASLAMALRLHGEADHPLVASGRNNLAACQQSLGRFESALPHFEASLAMVERLHGDRDHPDVAQTRNNVGHCLQSLGRSAEALPHLEGAAAMYGRLLRGGDHPDAALNLNNVAACQQALGRRREALASYEAAVARNQRLFGDADHPVVALSLTNLAACLQSMGRAAEALPPCQLAVAMLERLRDRSRTSATVRQALFDHLKGTGAFERLQSICVELGRASDAWSAAERSRARGLLDLVEEQRFDAFAEAERRARQRGDADTAARLTALRGELEAASLDCDRLLHLLTQADDGTRSEEALAARRGELVVQSNAAARQLRQLLDERARLLGDVLWAGKVRSAAEVQAVLQEGETLLQFTITKDRSHLYLLARHGDVEVVELPAAFATVARVLPDVLRQLSMPRSADRGRDPAAARVAPQASEQALQELFGSLVPPAVWQRIRGQRRIFVAAHRELHRLPFELLVTEAKDGKPVHWLDVGPDISYVPSGSALHWLRRRTEEVRDDATGLDLLAVGDPRDPQRPPEVPEHGAYVVTVGQGGEGARVGLQPGDVLVSYDGKPLADDRSLFDQRVATEVAIEGGARDRSPVPIRVWRRGETIEVHAKAGLLGIEVGQGKARDVFEASLDGAARTERITRAGELERVHRLPPLRGARAETAAIEGVFVERQRKAKRLLGEAATEPSVFDLAAKAKYLHFACHGVAEEFAGQSFSMLVLSLPRRVLPGDDGLLKLGDLFHDWRGRLSSCRLVVLSACRTNVGPTHRDEAPQALPVGFLFAGAPAVISSLWAVDDASTRELMTDFYGRLLAGESDRLQAFTAAKKVLRAKYPDPYHWAPFLFLGCPE